MENKNPFGGILPVIIIAILLIFLWPPLLIALLIGGVYLWFRFRSIRKQMEQDLKDQGYSQQVFTGQTYDEQPKATYQDELFREQASRIKRDEEAEVIDVEFTRKDEEQEERQSL